MMNLHGWWCSESDERTKAVISEIKDIDIQGFKVVIDKFRIPKGGIVVDVGASIGDTAVAYARKGFSVIAIEPFPDSFECLVKNTAQLGNQVKCLSHVCGNGELVELNYTMTSDHGCRYVAITNKPEAVKSVKLDDMDLGRVDHIKIDVEGFELSVLKGAANVISACHPTLFVELNPWQLVHSGVDVMDVVEDIRSRDYKVFESMNDIASGRLFTSMLGDWCNVFCIHSADYAAKWSCGA